MTYIPEALLFLVLLCLTSQGVESRPSKATEDAGSEERLKRDAQGAHLESATFHDGKHNFGSVVNSYVSSEHNTIGTPKQGTSTHVQVSSTVLDIPKEKYIEKCVDYPLSSAKLRNKRSPFDYSGSTQNLNTNYYGGSHNFGHESHILTQQATNGEVFPGGSPNLGHESDILTQQAANGEVFQSHRFTTSPQIKKTEEKIISKICHWEKVSNPEQGSVDKTPERQKRAPFDYKHSTQSYGGNHVQLEEGSTASWDNLNHQAYQGHHIQNEYRQKRAPFDYKGSTQSYEGHHVQAEAGSTLNWDNQNHQAYKGHHIQNEYQNYRQNLGPATLRPNRRPVPYQPYPQPAHQQIQTNVFSSRGY